MKVSRETCSRCGRNVVRAAGQRWCRACHAAAMREHRARLRAERAAKARNRAELNRLLEQLREG